MKKTALLIIDVQNLLVGENPRNKELFVRTINRLIRDFRKNELPIIFIQHTNDAEIPEGSEAWKIWHEIEAEASDKRFSKSYMSAFKGTGLDDHLKENSIDSLVICGMQTDFCVDTTCRVAFELGYTLYVPKDATTTFDSETLTAEQIQQHHELIWSYRLAKIAPADEILSEILKG